jgi:hypothetical protein
VRLKFIIAIIALVVICIPTFGHTTASEWLDKGIALFEQTKCDEATQAYKAIEQNPRYATA